MRRYGWLRRIEALDPVADHAEVYRISFAYEFPWDYQRSLELALFRTYCVPSISELLSATGEFRLRPQKRYDDTALLMAELAENGYDSPRGREALRVVNGAHRRYTIGGEDMLYVLSTFVFEPIDWLRQFGWRPLTAAEETAAYWFYREVGARMGIDGVPETLEAFRAWKEEYELAHFRYSATNAEIGRYTLDLLCSWYPAPLRPAVRLATRGLLDERMREAFGFAPVPGRLPPLERAGLRGRARVERFLPPRTVSRATAIMAANRTYPGYPEGYRPSDLGAPPPPADLDPRHLR